MEDEKLVARVYHYTRICIRKAIEIIVMMGQILITLVTYYLPFKREFS
jgi:hypothetical protein